MFSAFYVKNVPPAERVVRLVLGVGAALAFLALAGGPVSYMGAASALGLAVSGLVGFCPACALVGRRLKSAR